MTKIEMERILSEWEVEGDPPIATCAVGVRDDVCPRCFNSVTPDIQGHCPICHYCIYCEI